LADLLKRIRSEETTLWVPRAAKQYREGDVVKCACPECCHVSIMSGFDEAIAYVCDGCGAGVDVEPFGQGEG